MYCMCVEINGLNIAIEQSVTYITLIECYTDAIVPLVNLQTILKQLKYIYTPNIQTTWSFSSPLHCAMLTTAVTTSETTHNILCPKALSFRNHVIILIAPFVLSYTDP